MTQRWFLATWSSLLAACVFSARIAPYRAAQTVSGTLSGLASGALALTDGQETINLTSNGAFQFPTPLAAGTAYVVSVSAAPACTSLNCAVSNASGMAGESAQAVSVSCQVAPRLLFSDLTAGAGSGGDNGDGAYVHLYGLGFGTFAGTVRLGGKPVNVIRWGGQSARGLERIVVQLRADTSYASGSNFAVTVGTASSNALPFSVVSGHLFVVDAQARSNGVGTSSRPFNALPAATGPTDIVYVRGSFAATTVSTPLALVAYPGSEATFASGLTVTADAITLAELSLGAIAVSGALTARVIGNTFASADAAPLLSLAAAGHARVAGNLFAGAQTALVASATSPLEIAWNEINGMRGSGITVSAASTLAVHDNAIAETGAEGIALAADVTGVSVVNNVITDNGLDAISFAHPSCAAAASFQVWQNTLGSTGAPQTFSPFNHLLELGAADGTCLDIRNNLFFIFGNAPNLVRDNPFVGTSSNAPLTGASLTGNFYNLTAPAWDSAAIANRDPGFVAENDFRLHAASAAIGVDTSLAIDFRGVTRASPPDSGAFQYCAGLDP